MVSHPEFIIGAVIFLVVGVVCLGFPRAFQSYTLWCIRRRPRWLIPNWELKWTSSEAYLIEVRLMGAMSILMSAAWFYALFKSSAE